MLLLAGVPVTFWSKSQSSIALSSGEAELNSSVKAISETGCNQFVGRTHEVPAARDGEGGLERMQRNVDEKRKWTSEAFEHQAVVGAVSRGGVPACSPALQQKQKLQDNFRSWCSFA